MDDDIFSSIVNHQPAETVQQPKPQPEKGDIFDSGLGGISFGTSPQPTQSVVNNNDPFNMLGIDMGGSSVAQPTSVNEGNNLGFDILGFGTSSTTSSPQLQNNNFLGGDLMGFATNPVTSPQSQGGLSFNNPPANTFNQIPLQQPPQNNFGFNLLGVNSVQPTQSVQPTLPVQTQVAIGFQPIVNTNPNKILAYDNQHIQIWMDCVKENQDTTKLLTTYVNKTNSLVTEVAIQAAVLKHVKLTINPLSSTTLQPYSREVVHQVIYF